MATIKIPKTPASAYNPKRRPNALILAHVRGLQERLKEKGGKLKKETVATEATAAAYIRHLTRSLHEKTLLPDSKVTLTIVPPATAKPKKAVKRKSARKRRRS